MIKILQSDYAFHFFGKPYVSYFMEYGKTKDDFGLDQYKKLVAGEKIFAIHMPDRENKSSYFIYDVDGPNDEGITAHPVALELKKYLEGRGYQPTLFFSGSKGFHLYIFFDTKYGVDTLRRLGLRLLESFSIPENVEIELFPKNDNIDFAKKVFGNHLKAPLSKHPKTNFVSAQLTDYILNIKKLEYKKPESKEPKKPNLSISKETKKIIDIEMLSQEIAPHFINGSRHKIALGITGHFKRNGIDKDSTLSLFKRLIDLSGGDTADINRVVEDTYTSSRELADLGLAGLPPKVDEVIYSFTTGTSPNLLNFNVKQIRSTKKLPHIKVELAANHIIDFISLNYKTFHDENFIYVIDGDKIYSNFDKSFESLLILFGVNTEESFGRQVRKVILDSLYTHSVCMQPINFSEFKNNKINLYTKESIINIDGIRIDTVNEFLPVTNKKDFTYIEPLNRKKSLKDFIKKFNLKPKDADLIFAWLVTQLFNEGINTKPVLLIQGQPQAGKSTLANFLMRMIEDKKSEVIAFTGKDDALIASLQKHKVLVLDNLEYIAGKTLDLINSVVTGAVIELRALYTTNNVARIKPRSSLVITSAHGSFDNDGAFQSRLIRVRLSDRSGFAVESVFWDDFEYYYNDLVSDLIDTCSIVIRDRVVDPEKNYRIRMTDFIDICSILKGNGVIETDIEQMLIEEQEREKYKTPYLEIFMKIRFKEELYHPFTIREIFPRFRAVAATFGIDKLTSVNLGQKLLKTGIFTVTSAGFYKLLQPIYYSLENTLD